jgi:hypothetical protein
VTTDPSGSAPQTFTFQATVIEAGGQTLVWKIGAAYLENHGDTYLLVDANGAVVAAFPLGTVIVRSDVMVPPS